MRYCCISIDVECDKGPNWLIKKPMQFTSVHHTIPDYLQPCLQAAGAKATYLLSPEVLNDPKNIKILSTVRQQGAELGTHLHSEFVPPFDNTGANKTQRMQNEYPRHIEEKKIVNLTERFKTVFNFSPTAFRAGRFGLSNHTLTILQKYDYCVDSSVAPFSSWKNEIDFFGAPTQPYFPDQHNFRQKGDMHIVEIPVTIGACWWEYIPPALFRVLPPTCLFWGVLRKHLFLNGKFTPVWLRPTFATTRQMKKLEKRESRKVSDVFLNMMFHSVEFSAGNSPYAQSREKVNDFKRELETTLNHLKIMGYKFVTLTEAAKIFRKRYEHSTHHRIRTPGRS
ncbi:hypothetical protein GF407_05800 [candidate division KSB1 bacterium]|nr:hypothetical protein [candidate division KSB1 bacterium]